MNYALTVEASSPADLRARLREYLGLPTTTPTPEPQPECPVSLEGISPWVLGEVVLEVPGVSPAKPVRFIKAAVEAAVANGWAVLGATKPTTQRSGVPSVEDLRAVADAAVTLYATLDSENPAPPWTDEQVLAFHAALVAALTPSETDGSDGSEE